MQQIIHKYECGCIGIPMGDSEKCFCISACDRDAYDAPISFYIRDMGEKPSTPLPVNEQETWVHKLDALISDGYMMRTLAQNVKHILNRDQ